ncbi:MAG: PAS domain S-box protein [Alphaproteobacteria bacterium]
MAQSLPGDPATGIDAAILACAPTLHYARRAGRSLRLVYVSPNAERLTGIADRALLGAVDGWLALVHDDDRARYRAALAHCGKAGEAEVDYRLRDARGTVRWVRDTLRRNDDLVVGTVVDIARERTAEGNHADAAELLRAMVRSALDAVIATDDDGVVIEFNPAAEAMFGYARSEAVGQPIVELIVPPALRERHEAGMARFRATGGSSLSGRRLKVEAQRRDGGCFPVELTIAPARIGGRTVFVGEIRDLTERVAAAAERDRITDLLRDAIESLPVGFSVTDRDDRILLCNEVFARGYARPAAEMRGRSRLELAQESLPNMRAVDGEPFEASPAQVDRLRARLGNPDGAPMEIELASGRTVMLWSTRLSAGGVVCVRTDVTQIRRAETMMRESTEVIRRVLDSCPVPIGMTRAADGLVIYESAASKALFGRDAAVSRVSARAAFVDPEDRDRYVATLRAVGRVDGFEVLMKRFDGRQFWAALSARLIEFHGEPVIVSSTFDLTERRAVEAELGRQREALHQSEKLAALGELLAGVAHELNNPLSVVIGQALLLEETARDPTIAGRIGKITRAADRCVRIVRSFLSMARQQPRREDVIDLDALVRQTIEVAEHGLRATGVAVELRLAPELPPIEGDVDQLIQVMTNLIFNAENALREVSGQRRLEIETRRDGELVQVVVRDNGPGIPKELHRRVFEPFFTTKEAGSGTGVGLAYCHRVVESHGGSIALESAPGQGAAFTVTLPTARRRVDSDPAASAEPAPGGHRILVIDDEADVADIVASMLRAQGHAVDVAHSGQEALDRIGSADYGAILSDLRMPGLDGERLYDHLRRERPALADRVAFITGDAMGRRAEAFLRRSGRPVLEKPIRPAEAGRLIAGIVEGRQGAASTTRPLDG